MESIHTIVFDLDEQYCDENIAELCDHRDWSVPEVLSIAEKNNWSLPFGVRTFLRWEEVDKLRERLDPPEQDNDIKYNDVIEPGQWIETGTTG